MRKKWAALLVAAVMLFSHASAAEIYTKTTTNTIANGIEHRTITKFMGDHWQSIQVVKADLNQEHVGLELLKNPEAMNILNSVSYFASAGNTVAAVNGDFFAWYGKDRSKGSPVGLEVKDGALLSTPATEPGMAAAMLGFDNILRMGYITGNVTLIAPNGNTWPIKHINKYDDLSSIVLYTKDWNRRESPGSYNGIFEMVVEDNVVTDLRWGQPPVEIPENGYVLATLPDFVTFLGDNFQVGDPVELRMDFSTDLAAIETGIGAGAVLVENGKAKTSFSHNATGYNPRTALGVDDTGRIVYLVTVDGRQSHSRGMTQTELAQLMVELGAYTAVNLDGGGSTTMVTQGFWEDAPTLKNKSSDGGYGRAVVNALGITSKREDAIGGLYVEAASEAMVGAAVPLKAAPTDRYGNRLALPEGEAVSWSVSGVEGTVKNNVFYPASAGTAQVVATYGGFSASATIACHRVSRIEVRPALLTVGEGASQPVTVTGYNRAGFGMPLLPQAISFDSSIAMLQADGTVYGQTTGSEVVSYAAGDAVAYGQIAVGASVAADAFAEENGSYLPYPATVEGAYTMEDGAGRLDYVIEDGEAQAAHVAFSGGGYAVPAGVKTISVSAKAETTNPVSVKAMFADAEGTVYRVNMKNAVDWTGWQQLQAAVPAEAVQPVKLTRLYVVGSAACEGSLWFDNLMFGDGEITAEVLRLPENQWVRESFEKEVSKENAVVFSVTAIRESTLLNNLMLTNVKKQAGGATWLQLVVGGGFGGDLPAGAFSSKTLPGALVVNTDGQFAADTWTKLYEAIQAADAQNVFVCLPQKPASGQNKEILEGMLAQSGRRGFVVYNGDTNSIYTENGVHYVSVGDMGSQSWPMRERCEAARYLEVTVGSELGMVFRPIF